MSTKPRSLLPLRWVLTALVGCLAIALLANGSIVIGGLLAVIAVVRVVLLAQVTQRRKRWAGYRGRGPTAPGSSAPGPTIDV